MVNRGRVLFVIFALLIVLNEAANILFAFSGMSANFQWFKSVILPVLLIGAVWSLWETGEKWTRWGLATWALLKGITSLWVLGYVMYRMAEITPPENADSFFRISDMLFTMPVIHASIFVVIGLAFFFSPSIRLFLETRSPSSDQGPDQDPPFESQ
ncbi:hypothetical protein FF011L_30160 [Roseimaritima multifibrata]|uniref:Uncharacterized protein n=2 Tax=Roseimaritima multifibrata TaxID=1930274 RepID=A0A517MHI3_9BACT|nr:hypothetical protein FF011L_30160 [Roseimaritima multifibrata]